ncbi:MAG: hypothetical protein JSV25_16330 [Spirochaetota bacterium]|nr:MAG: hypothetical protein JSV25_16330 [Spirochaetota bacterium]
MKLNEKSSYPPQGYKKKIVHPNGSCPLSHSFTQEQIERRISFYEELNETRDKSPHATEQIEKQFAIYGWKDTTTIRVYMRETIEKIANELFISDYSICVRNVHPEKNNVEIDRDHGHVHFIIRATVAEIEALLKYIKPGASYFVYDGEQSKYVAGDTSASEFIITKPSEQNQPERYFRRSQSFISRIEEL